jgi:hypothetical protein
VAGQAVDEDVQEELEALAFAGGLQAHFLTLALWLQVGEHYSPLRAGLTAIAFSAGGFLCAPFAVPLAQRYGRRVLALGAILLTAEIVGTIAGSHRVGLLGGPWPTSSPRRPVPQRQVPDIGFRAPARGRADRVPGPGAGAGGQTERACEASPDRRDHQENRGRAGARTGRN